MNIPDRRFVRVRLPDVAGASHTMTFLASDPNDTHSPESHGVVEHVRQTDPAKAAAVAHLLKYLKENEAAFFSWLEQDPANSTAFANDPVGTLKSILPEAPIDGIG